MRWGGGATGLFLLWSPAGCVEVLPSFQIQAGDVLWHLKEKGNAWSLTGGCNLVFPYHGNSINWENYSTPLLSLNSFLVLALAVDVCLVERRWECEDTCINSKSKLWAVVFSWFQKTQ